MVIMNVQEELEQERLENEERVLQYRELMLLAKPNVVSRVRDRVPKPRNALPTNPLPLWHLLGLDRKIPSVPAPEGTFVNTRTGISQGVTPRHS